MKTILIIEDDPAIQQGLHDALTEEHFSIVSSTDGEKGYQMAKRETVALSSSTSCFETRIGEKFARI